VPTPRAARVPPRRFTGHGGVVPGLGETGVGDVAVSVEVRLGPLLGVGGVTVGRGMVGVGVGELAVGLGDGARVGSLVAVSPGVLPTGGGDGGRTNRYVTSVTRKKAVINQVEVRPGRCISRSRWVPLCPDWSAGGCPHEGMWTRCGRAEPG
jgi:hypothetical protein